MRAFTFPGQGSQAVGMGQELADTFPEAKAVFEEVNDALGQDLSAIMWNGPAEDLTLTENAQPALMAVSIAAMRALESMDVNLKDHASYVAGHSLGEYSALCAAGTFSLSDTAKLLKIRGQAMQAAVPVGMGAMAALIGLEFDAAAEVAAEAAQGEICQAANDNAPGQVVISGSKAAIDRAIDIAKAKGAKRALPLPVSAPFHCAMMQPAADAMAEALGNVEMNDPIVPLVANVRAEAITDAATIRNLLVEQVTGSVRWRESVLWMGNYNASELLEVGTGKVLTGMVRRINKEMTGRAINTADDIRSLAEDLSA